MTQDLQPCVLQLAQSSRQPRSHPHDTRCLRDLNRVPAYRYTKRSVPLHDVLPKGIMSICVSLPPPSEQHLGAQPALSCLSAVHVKPLQPYHSWCPVFGLSSVASALRHPNDKMA